MEVERVLERIGPKNEQVVINKNFFYCGRMKESDLVCLSLLVSREHCLFTKLSDGLYVTDLGSSNGVFVNGSLIRQKKQILLKENDYIGIGCADTTNLDESMFVYKVKNRVVLHNDCDSSTSVSHRLVRKEQSRTRRIESNNYEVPAKLAKKTNVVEDNDDDDIEIIECASTSDSIKPKADLPETREELVKQVIVPDIIDITDAQVSSVHENNNGIMQVDLIPSVHNLKNEPVQSDTTDTAAIDANSSTVDANIKQEVQNDLENNIPTAIVKSEPDWGCFSQIDLVEINDDDDSIFPFSQLFDKTSVKQECEDDNGNDLPHSSLFFDDDDDNIVTILDSDDENPVGVNEEMYPVQNIKKKSSLEFVDVEQVADPSVSDVTDNLCLDNLNVPSNQDIDFPVRQEFSTSNIDKTPQSLNEQSLSLHEEPEATTSKDTSTSKRTKRKGLEIIEPHFLKPKKTTEKTDKNDASKSKDKEESKQKKTDKKKDMKKKHSSDSSKNSSRVKGTSEKSSSKGKEHKKNKDHSLKHSSKSNSHSDESRNNDKRHTDEKHKNASLEKSKKHKDSNKDEIEKKKNDENHDEHDSNSVENTTMNAQIQNQPRPRNKTTIVKVKVSTKTRGDMLCDSMQILRPKPRKDSKIKSSESEKSVVGKNLEKPDNFSSFVIPRRQVPSSISSNSISMISQLNTPPSTSCSKEITSTVLKNATNQMNVSPSSSENNERRSPSSTVESVTNGNDISMIPPSLKSALKIHSVFNTSQKRVLFKENIVAVREFPIEEGNQMRNIKDGLGIRSTKKDFAVYRATELKIEDFLARVFAWEPVWLEQQQQLKTLPPIVKLEDMQQLPNTFNCFEQYYRRMEVLLLLETWQQLVKEYECTGHRYTSSVVLPCTIVRHSIRQMQTPNGLRYSIMNITTLVSKNQLRLQKHPVYGDMIILEYVIKQGDIQQMRRAFAYVMQVQQQNSLKFLRSNEQLCKYVTSPDAQLTYTVYTRIIDEHTLQFEQIARLRSILYLRSHLRLIQGLQYIPHSELCDSILKVNINQFQLESVADQQINKYHLVTKEKLNAKQMEAVIKFTNASVKLEPKIGLLVGPPGTGKSKVIANLVTQILYGDGRYVGGRPLRILLCAPSNAAIDEIVLRLLEIRGAIKEHRFKMVRIGRMESMHEEVKKISVSELARREAQKLYVDQQHKISENVEHKKHKLKNDIDALELLVASNPKNNVYKRDLESLKAKYKKLTNKSPEEEAAELSKLENSTKTIILQKANVIACTLSSCYTSQMETIFGGNSEKIATCIVDEATQCCEAETLIPLMLGVKSLILVGDPNQLPATVMSTDAKKLGLDRSLFTRAKEALEPQYNNVSENNRDPVITLNMQYRMVHAISYWPNRYFYGGKLSDIVDYRKSFPFQSYRVLNLDGIQDNIKFSNTSEAVFVGNLIHSLMTCDKVNSWDKKITVGVITPYQNQKSLILSTIKEQTKNVPDNLKSKFATEVNTIDSFQGQERDVIIMSCVRSSGIGFLSDPQRLCVALTRAKFTLIICGNFTTFQKDSMWKDLLQDARSRGVVARLNTTAKLSEITPHVVRLD